MGCSRDVALGIGITPHALLIGPAPIGWQLRDRARDGRNMHRDRHHVAIAKVGENERRVAIGVVQPQLEEAATVSQPRQTIVDSQFGENGP